ncbi:hypothetical protein ACDI89_25435 (plasmid) [Mycobacteroides abscessus]|nr:hypothetical protein [Mycobacteroides abscessus]MBE5408218.1 hypothetical protein [Mycobacteroides abscessus]MBN7468751.1 hypothetical protein [Mycobacteroides abscessus subsp. massiliense]SLC56762.1 Uncharacterised protein [Mycobacteroides abscessus subsp. massiliense]SLC80906.1 Uncharacterised protein [Mycobacteroides abscessus subsp. massiliense]SLJ52630.1 Uncharacterised protein [Mycobacteroides abscessus subsp. massiliense]
MTAPTYPETAKPGTTSLPVHQLPTLNSAATVQGLKIDAFKMLQTV